MARIREFRGLRPGKDIAVFVAELPYDVVNTQEAKAAADKSKYNFYHITRSEIDLQNEVNVYSDAVYNKGMANLQSFIKEGVFVEDESENFYLYTLIMQGRAQTGLVTLVNIEDYQNNLIKKHELVLDSKAEDRRKHISFLNAQTGLVFLFYKEDGLKKRLFEKAINIKPDYDFTSCDGIRHIFRVISDKEMINDFKKAFEDRILYIADGHHRAYSAVKVGLERKEKNPHHNGEESYNWFISVVFPHDDLKIMSYNRVIVDLNGLSTESFLKKIEQTYIIEKQNTDPEKHCFRMYMEHIWYKLIPKFSIPDDAVKSLDAQILQDTILDPVLDIKNPKNDKRIDFVGGIRGEKELERLIDSGKFSVAFSLEPVIIDELIRVSDENKLMPPKSTWFEPKLRDGLIIHRL
ncbi:MAG: DUF1015 domain-containing protein [Spirochaetes bacterium]|nr:DUF1015 domain-containing protein [Spirochaetota bacterium]